MAINDKLELLTCQREINLGLGEGNFFFCMEFNEVVGYPGLSIRQFAKME